MRTENLIYSLLLIFILLSCNTSKTKINDETYATYQKKGDKITGLAQATLLGNVGKAIQEGGTKYAVEFCNLKASSIVDSLSSVNKCTISRVSEKNRNPKNFLKNETEIMIVQKMQAGVTKDTLIRAENSLIYYKPIRTALPACLKCHGNPESDINAATLHKINELYPIDLATGYRINDFRGMWKVKFNLP